jgi:hypothetical protein
LARLSSLFAVIYVAFVLLVMLTLYGDVQLEPRMILPFFIASTLAASSFLNQQLNASAKWPTRRFMPGRLYRPVLYGLGGLFVLSHVYVGVRYAKRIHEQGIGATSLAWQHSPLIVALGRLPTSAKLWTNLFPVKVLSPVAVSGIPSEIDPWSRRSNPDFSLTIASIRPGDYLAIAPPSEGKPNGILDALNLETLSVTPDGNLYLVR